MIWRQPQGNPLPSSNGRMRWVSEHKPTNMLMKTWKDWCTQMLPPWYTPQRHIYRPHKLPRLLSCWRPQADACWWLNSANPSNWTDYWIDRTDLTVSVHSLTYAHTTEGGSEGRCPDNIMWTATSTDKPDKWVSFPMNISENLWNHRHCLHASIL